MHRLLDVLQAMAYLVGMGVMIHVGIQASRVLADVRQELRQDRLRHEQMLKEHIEYVKEHQRRMDELERR